MVEQIASETKPWHKFYDEASLAYDPTTTRYSLLGDLPGVTAEKFGQDPAFTICLPNGATASLTYTDIDRLTDHFAVYLREELGLKRGDVVAIQSPNSLAYPITVFGVLKAGGIITNTNPLYTEPEMIHQFNDSGAKVLVVIDMFGDKVDKVINQTKIEKVIALSITDFMPFMKRLIIGAVLKYVKKQVPDMRTPATPFTTALAIGERLMRQRNVDVSGYTNNVKTDDDAVYQYTGGTTGVSKGAALTHRNILSNLDQGLLALAGDLEVRSETVLTALPLYHIFAFTINMCVNMGIGGHNILIPSPRPLENVKPAFEKFNITWMTGVNTLYAGLLQADWFDAKLKLAAAGGTALQTVVAEKWAPLHGPIVEGYGLTESSPIICFNPIPRPRNGFIGIPVAGLDIKLIDEQGNLVPEGEPGELCAKGPNIMRGYLNRPEATAETIVDGWLHTGDIATVDADGYYKIVDRKKDMILVSGFNVYPNELEDCIATLEGVAEVAVIGVPDEKTGETPKAFIVKASDSLTEDQIKEHCKSNLTGYKMPRHIEFRDELPKTPVGKVLRKELKKEEQEKNSAAA